MGTGLGLLRLAPRDFWAMTPREFECAVHVFSGPGAPERGVITEMMAMFPDTIGKKA